MLARGSAGRRLLVEEVSSGRRRDNTIEYPKLIQASGLFEKSPLLRDVSSVPEGLTWVGAFYLGAPPGSATLEALVVSVSKGAACVGAPVL
jgi:hypothetical protein